MKNVFNKIKFFAIVIVQFFFVTILFAQKDSSNFIKYTSEFKFIEGIFINFYQVKNNNPIPKSRILTSVSYSDMNYFDKVLGNKKIYYYDQNGMKQEIISDKIWGYSQNGILFIFLAGEFHRITLVGSVCHFVANVVVYYPRYRNTHYYNPYYYYRYGTTPYATTTKEMRQCLFDFETGKVMDYDEESIEVILMRDTELYDEYSLLKKRKKKQLKFLYLRKYNERHPLYFPVH